MTPGNVGFPLPLRRMRAAPLPAVVGLPGSILVYRFAPCLVEKPPDRVVRGVMV